jgi:hypothetical protein
MKVPKYKELANRDVNGGLPKFETWQYFPDTSLGRLTLLTPERVLRAKELVKTGEVVNLDWTTDKPYGGCFARGTVLHEIHHFPMKEYGVVIDDTLHFNSQCGSQWDGLWHFADQHTGFFYGGKRVEDIVIPAHERSGGMSSWADHGIVGRAVLLDIYRWSKMNGKPYDPFTSHDITVEDLLACAEEENVSFEPGDILVIRSGYTVHHNQCNATDLENMRENRTFAGVEQSEDMEEFLHDNLFAAVAGDAPSFESMPPKKDYFLHERLLACWGVPIGEFWDLETLSEVCVREKRWQFMLTSKVLNVPGGIASTPNAMAIF